MPRKIVKRRLSIFCCFVIGSGAFTPAFAQQVIRVELGGSGLHTGPAGILPAAAFSENPALIGGVSSLQGALTPTLSAPGLTTPSAALVPGALAPALSVPSALVGALALKSVLPAAATADKPGTAIGAAQALDGLLSAAADGDKPEAPSALDAAKKLAAESGDQPAGASPAFDGAELVPFRLKIRQPGVYLLENDGSTKDDSVGRKLTASLQTADISAALKAHAVKTLSGNTLYVTGVEMGSEQDALKRVREAVAGIHGGPDEVKIQILSIPRPRSQGILRALRDRIVYFMPSMRRDYQAPLRDEVISGALSTLILELPNAFYLFTVLPSPDAAIVLTVHSALLASYTIWQRAMGNWILRASGTELFLKQLLTGLPFVLNYNVLSRYSELSNFYQAHGVSGMLQQFPAQLLQFSVTQGLTTLLQTVFYSWVVIRGFRVWAAGQKSPQDAEAARSWVSWLLMPWLWLDAIFLTQAATSSTILFQWHSFALTLGHLSLAGLTVLGSIIVFYPWLLDKTLPAYKWIRAWIGKLKGGI